MEPAHVDHSRRLCEARRRMRTASQCMHCGVKPRNTAVRGGALEGRGRRRPRQFQRKSSAESDSSQFAQALTGPQTKRYQPRALVTSSAIFASYSSGALVSKPALFGRARALLAYGRKPQSAIELLDQLQGLQALNILGGKIRWIGYAQRDAAQRDFLVRLSGAFKPRSMACPLKLTSG
jgi:hypothetical protein